MPLLPSERESIPSAEFEQWSNLFFFCFFDERVIGINTRYPSVMVIAENITAIISGSAVAPRTIGSVVKALYPLIPIIPVRTE